MMRADNAKAMMGMLGNKYPPLSRGQAPPSCIILLDPRGQTPEGTGPQSSVAFTPTTLTLESTNSCGASSLASFPSQIANLSRGKLAQECKKRSELGIRLCPSHGGFCKCSCSSIAAWKSCRRGHPTSKAFPWAGNVGVRMPGRGRQNT